MNDIEKQEPESPVPETAEPTESAVGSDVSQAPPKPSTRIAWIALLLALGGFVMSYMKWSDLDGVSQQEVQELADFKKQQQKDKGRLDELEKAISAQQAALTKQEERLKLEREGLLQQAEEMKASIDMVFERVGRDSTQWIAAEAEYLMRIANHRLQLEGDSATALVALEGADRRLHDSGDPLWTPVREQLAVEMAGLKALKQLDLDGQALKLSGFISQIEKLQLPQSNPEQDDQSAEEKEQKKDFNLDVLLHDMWEGFKSLVVIRHHDRPVTAMLEPEQRFFLYQNLRLQLETARFALLRRDQSQFTDSLERAEKWLKEFFDQGQALTKSMLEEISALKGLELEAKLPDISGSLRMLLKQQGRIQDDQGDPGLGAIEGQRFDVAPSVDNERQNTEEPEQASQGQGQTDTERKETP